MDEVKMDEIKPFIITNEDKLRNKSEKVSIEEGKDIVRKLITALPDNAVGLAAPQIEIQKRVFLAKISTGKYAFVNPAITKKSPDKRPSIESCLSIPNVVRCVERHNRIRVEADAIYLIGETWPDCKSGMGLSGHDAAIVQHEYDHLDGILIIDLPEVLTPDERRTKKSESRAKKILQKRKEKKKKSAAMPPKLSPKTLAKKKKADAALRKLYRKEEEAEKMRVEKEEREKIKELKLFE